MAEFVESFNGLNPSLPFMDMESSLEIMSQFGELHGSIMEHPRLGLMGFSNENYSSLQLEFSTPFVESLLECPKAVTGSQPIASVEEESQKNKKRKAKEMSETSTGNSSVTPSKSVLREDNKSNRKYSSGRGKRSSSSSKDEVRAKEVVHVRARRGQATDSHSLAERVRREKINERMRCLQDLVPGCYKTMGMAVMLDEIINYIQSLQNQVQFLSMKLLASSSFYDFNLDMKAMTAPQTIPRVGNEYEAQEVERLVREGHGGGCGFHSSMPF